MPPLISATPAPWPIVAGPCGADGPDGIDPDVWAAAVAGASSWLWALSGRQFGLAAVAWRPEWTNPPLWRRGGTMYGWGWGAAYPFSGTGLALGRCAPVVDGRVTTLPGPVVSVEEVRIDGQVLTSTAYTVDGDRLVRIDGQQWPTSQDTTVPVTQPGTWQVTYTRGRPVPPGGQSAAGILACELAAAMTGSKSCALPANTVQVVRQGVTISRQLDQLNLGFTGLFAVDQWVRTVNPKGLSAAPVVYSPDLDPTLYPPVIGANQ